MPAFQERGEAFDEKTSPEGAHGHGLLDCDLYAVGGTEHRRREPAYAFCEKHSLCRVDRLCPGHLPDDAGYSLRTLYCFDGGRHDGGALTNGRGSILLWLFCALALIKCAQSQHLRWMYMVMFLIV